MNILVTGSGGQLGQCFKKYSKGLNDNYFFKNKRDLNILDYEKLDRFVVRNAINIIINCAAYTNVDKAENDKKKCFDINVLGLENLTKLCLKYNIFLIQFSTDYVFDGNLNYPLNEDTKPSPINYYGLTKLESEKVFFSYNLRGVILRISWLYSTYGENFYTKIVEKLINNVSFDVISDQYSSPTNADFLAKNIIKLIVKRKILKVKSKEIFHLSDLGHCSKYDFVSELNNILYNRSNIKPISTNELFLLAKRPKFSAFDNNKIQKYFDISLKSWNFNLKNYVKKI